MLLGAPAWASKKTLCATPPKANVTVSPALTVSDAGVNANDGVADTVRPSPGDVGVPSPPPPHAPSVTAISASAAYSLCAIEALLIVCLPRVCSLRRRETAGDGSHAGGGSVRGHRVRAQAKRPADSVGRPEDRGASV